LHDLVSIPYVNDGRCRKGLDCYGLVHLFHKEFLGIEIPSLSGVSSGQIMVDDLTAMVESESSIWSEISKPTTGDVILFHSGRSRHVGIVFSEGYMIHTVSGTTACIEKYDSIRWRSKIIGHYRHKCNRADFTA
jgi:cell wall-associated NlpC family hydrolase